MRHIDGHRRSRPRAGGGGLHDLLCNDAPVGSFTLTNYAWVVCAHVES